MLNLPEKRAKLIRRALEEAKKYNSNFEYEPSELLESLFEKKIQPETKSFKDRKLQEDTIFPNINEYLKKVSNDN
jgi:hypothetical protein